MSQCVIIKNDMGRLQGVDAANDRAYQKWINLVRDVEVGQTLAFSFRLPRSPEHHKLFFAKVGALCQRSETFSDPEKLRMWLILGAGYADFIPGMDGQPVAIPRSMNFENMDETTFSELHRCINDFLWTPHAQRVLWPHLDAAHAYQCIDTFRKEFP